MATVRKTQPAASSPAPERSPAAASALLTAAPGAERIAVRAYQIWLESGRPEGHDLEHWLAAERELRAGPSSRTPRR
ncbi:MAG TPA: DUF2934 domain-containing protein [Anaeromyxobacteraceae bacterium]|nr:DUF2934 domain-containing protein [Anaeromyxobacteraceae bacterium]